jgi:hypothetical protein
MDHRKPLTVLVCVFSGCAASTPPAQTPADSPGTVTVADPNEPPPRPVQSDEPKAGSVPRSTEPGAAPPSPVGAPELAPAPPAARPGAPADPAYETL